MAGSDLQGAVQAAMSSTRAVDIEAGVKDAVAKEIRRLDPLAKVSSTDFFNHSYAPDFVLTWQDGRTKSRRDLYLRPSLRAGVDGDELATLKEVASARHTDPFMLALKSNDEPEVLERAAVASALSPGVLVTDVSALDDIANASPSDTSPIAGLVQANIVRGGRGLVLEAQVTELVSLEALTPEGGMGADDFLNVVKRNFDEQAVARFERSTQLLAMAITGDLSLLDAPEGERPGAVGGRLSKRELQLVLPFLLTADNITEEPRFWTHLGSLTSLEALEAVSASLTNLDITRLVRPNLASWRANRAAIALYTPEFDHEETAEDAEREPSSVSAVVTDDDVALPAPDVGPLTVLADPEQSEKPAKPLGKRAAAAAAKAARVAEERAAALDPRGRWLMHARMISTVVGDYRLHITATGQRLKAHDGLTVRWSDIQPVLEQFDLAAVDVLGLDRSLVLKSTSVVEDIDAIRETVTDDYHVANVTVKARPDEDQVSVQFNNSIAIAASTAPAGEIGRMALRLLGYRQPVLDTDVEEMLPL